MMSDFTQEIEYHLRTTCPYGDCGWDINESRHHEYDSGESIQCPGCQRFFDLGEEL